MPSLSGDESGNERELANTEPSIQPSASQERVNLQHNIGRRRRRCDTGDEEDCSPVVGSDAKQGKDKDVVQPPRGKRRRRSSGRHVCVAPTPNHYRLKGHHQPKA
ncbi:hypothetical protein N658DRAFT_490488 [Parathielavia hyrcaniae]|uniref:Uncharacterized protein n=1 Tax=Parathielavia hyrcaniae TaxID=113614 RepID=A0AAN6SWT1_9PEZI|nr:hypothetical protein N658DRAFT_490488 [Parathielavia hyrcaniae]